MFATRIVALRKSKKMTQEELADAVGISRAALSHYEKKRREPDFETIQLFADFFEVSVDYLLGRTDQKDGHTTTRFNDSLTSRTKQESFGSSPDQNPLGIELTQDQLEFLREMSEDPDTILMFKDFAKSTPEDRRMMLDIWQSIQKRGKDDK